MLNAPTEEDAARILWKHGFPAEGIVMARAEGIANTVFFAAGTVVRIGSNPEYHCDAYREPITVPIALASGVRMARLLLLDDDRDVYDGPVTLYERAPGVTATRVSLSDSFFLELGEQVALLHEGASRTVDPRLEDPGYQDPLPHIRESLLKGLISQGEAEAWLAWLEILRPAFEVTVPHVFVHNDLHLGNLLASEDGRSLTAILDWSDAGWWDPAVEFRSLPVRGLVTTVKAYVECRAMDAGFEGRVLAEVMTTAFRRLLKTGERGLLEDMIAFGRASEGRWIAWSPT